MLGYAFAVVEHIDDFILSSAGVFAGVAGVAGVVSVRLRTENVRTKSAPTFIRSFNHLEKMALWVQCRRYCLRSRSRRFEMTQSTSQFPSGRIEYG